MGRWLRLSIVALAVAPMLAGCTGEERETDTASPTATSVRTAAPTVTAAPQATGTATAGRSDGIPTVPAPAVTPQPPSPTAQPPAPTAQPPAPTPEPPTQEARQPQFTISQLPTEAQVQIVLEDGLGNAHIVASVDAEVVEWENWTVDHVGDLDADGDQDVIVLHFTGGAHCCFEYLIFSEGPSGIQRDDYFSLGNGGIGTVQDLNGDGVPELDGSDDRLAYFPDLSYADSPFLPLVLCRSADGMYHDCTPQFPQRLEQSAAEYEQALSDAVQRQGEDYEKRSPALGLLASYMRLDRDDEGWSKVASLCPECEAWLRQNQGELEERVRYQHPEPLFPE